MASNEVEKAVKRRSWGKARSREKIAVIDQMEVDVLMKESSRSADKRATCVDTSDIDLQHPELMASDTLTAILSQRRVPIPVYEDGKPSRERLIYLFKKHVTPQPQRDSYWRRPGRRGWRKRRRTDETPMEVDNTGAGDWVLNSDEDTPVQRKRWADLYLVRPHVCPAFITLQKSVLLSHYILQLGHVLQVFLIRVAAF